MIFCICAIGELKNKSDRSACLKKEYRSGNNTTETRRRLSGVVLVLILSSCACLPNLQIPTASPSPNPEPLVEQPAGLDHVKIFLVAIGDNGISGPLIGCGDSLVGVDVPIEPTLDVLQASLNELFKLDRQPYYGESGLYNALYLSKLSIENLAVENGEAIIRLKGKLITGGECDIPRIEGQLKSAVLQFATINTVSIFINGQPLEKLLDLQG